MGFKIPGTCYSEEKKGPCQEACKQSSGVGKHPPDGQSIKSNPGFGQKVTFSESQQKIQRIAQIVAVA